MKKYLVFALSVFLLFTACNETKEEPKEAAKPEAETTTAPFTVKFFVGDVKKVSNGNETAVSMGDKLTKSDIIKTGAQSTAELLYQEGGVLKLSENCEFSIATIFGEETEKTVLEMQSGEMLVSLSKLKKGTFEIKTPTMLAAVRGTSFLVSANTQTQTSQVSVLKGVVNVSPVENNVPVEHLSVDATPGKKVVVEENAAQQLKESGKTLEAKEMTKADLDSATETLNSLKPETVAILPAEVKEEIEVTAPKNIEKQIEKIELEETPEVKEAPSAVKETPAPAVAEKDEAAEKAAKAAAAAAAKKKAQEEKARKAAEEKARKEAIRKQKEKEAKEGAVSIPSI